MSRRARKLDPKPGTANAIQAVENGAFYFGQSSPIDQRTPLAEPGSILFLHQRQSVLQTVNVGEEGRLTDVDLQLIRDPQAWEDVYLDIVRFDEGKDEPTLLHRECIPAASIPTSECVFNRVWLTCHLPPSRIIRVEAGQVIGLRMHCLTASAEFKASKVGWAVIDQPLYPAGKTLQVFDGQPQIRPDSVMAFRTRICSAY